MDVPPCQVRAVIQETDRVEIGKAQAHHIPKDHLARISRTHNQGRFSLRDTALAAENFQVEPLGNS
ncbi:MAG: hypothetical protein A4E69_00044 [Syntrophus sp. PtaB.Bin138]|nr:MAG: hypothetical protein A4E69_00044 [Syntrophus sp. PtaB.Bin138]